MERLLTVKETADVLNCHYQTVRAIIKRGELPAAKIGTAGRSSGYRIKVSDIENYLQKRGEQHDRQGAR